MRLTSNWPRLIITTVFALMDLSSILLPMLRIVVTGVRPMRIALGKAHGFLIYLYNIWSPGGVFSGPCIACAMHSSALNEGNTIGRHQCQCEPGTEGRYTTPTALCGIRVYVSGWIIHIQMAQASDAYMGSADITDCAHSDHGGVGSVVRTMSKDSEE